MRPYTTSSHPLSGLLLCAAAALLAGCSSQNITTRIQIDGKTIRFDGLPGGNQVQETVQQRVAAEQVNRLDVDTSAGNIEILPIEDGSNTILIRATKVVTGSLTVEMLKPYLAKVKVTQRLQEGTLLVRANTAAGALPRNVGYYVSYVVKAPPRMVIQLKSISGDINVKMMQNGVTAQTSSGGIALKAVGTPLKLQTVSGDVKVENVAGGDEPHMNDVIVHTSSGAVDCTNITGRFHAESISGDITVEGASIRDSFTAATSSGALKFTGIRADGDSLDLNLHSVSGDIAYEGDADKIGVGTSSGSIEIAAADHLRLKEVKAESISGSLSLKLPGLKSAQINAHTISGSLELPTLRNNADEGDSDRHSASVRLGDGSTPVTLSTSSGDIGLEVER